jgi:hypothetical protein
MPDRVERQDDFLSAKAVRARLARNPVDERYQLPVSAWIGEKRCHFLAQLVESADERRRPRTTRSVSDARMLRSSPFHVEPSHGSARERRARQSGASEGSRARSCGARRYPDIRRLRSVRSRTQQHRERGRRETRRFYVCQLAPGRSPTSTTAASGATMKIPLAPGPGPRRVGATQCVARRSPATLSSIRFASPRRSCGAEGSQAEAHILALLA